MSYVYNRDCLCGACRAFGQGEHAAPSSCRSGCKTQDHASYAECLKDARLQIGNLK